MQRLEQRDLDDLTVFVAGFLYGFYSAILFILILRLTKSDVDSIDICFIDLTVQEIIRIPKSARTIAKIIYDILNRMK